MKDDPIIESNLEPFVNFLAHKQNFLPGFTGIINYDDFKFIYMNQDGLDIIKATIEEVTETPSEEFGRKFLNLDDPLEYQKKIKDILAKTNDTATFFQQITVTEEILVWHLTSLKIISRDENQKPLSLSMITIPIEYDELFKGKMNRVLEENLFLKQNIEKFRKLTKRELDLLKLFAQGKTAQEISETLFISQLTIETHRKNIRKKLGATSNYDVFKYASAFNLI